MVGPFLFVGGASHAIIVCFVFLRCFVCLEFDSLL
ncbi:MAG: hypothetical protein ACJARR_000001 [Pseudophaeobacter arcticus]|jgi:hypothetical protein